jgi:hypothetical protein
MLTFTATTRYAWYLPSPLTSGRPVRAWTLGRLVAAARESVHEV